jgi:hypothetical protein
MDPKAFELITAVMDMINGTLDNYQVDPHHAPAEWLLENWWCTLNAALQVGDHGDDQSDRLETTNDAKREKRDEQV